MRQGQHGFTLLELMVVLLVLALLAALIGPRFGRSRDADSLQATVYELASRCRDARIGAIRSGSDTVLLIDLGKRTVSVRGNPRQLLIPAAVTIHSETSTSEQTWKSVSGIRFHPNGSSSGGTLRLQAGQHAYEIRVNWFTGRVSVERL